MEHFNGNHRCRSREILRLPATLLHQTAATTATMMTLSFIVRRYFDRAFPKACCHQDDH